MLTFQTSDFQSVLYELSSVYELSEKPRVLEHKHKHGEWEILLLCECSKINIACKPFYIEILAFYWFII